ncbi:MAG: ferritin family protein [Spirochaetales bacterium]|nr:ferritin family protein [Spirochaetales bacterium]
MDSFESVDGVLDFAIEREQEASDFYTDLAVKAKRPDMKTLFKQFAGEEKGHKAKLQGVKEGRKLLPAEKQVLDLKMSDYLVADAQTEETTYQNALILAMKREKVSFRLYTDLAAKAPTDDLKNTFLTLAQEEAKHKLRFEVEYDNEIMAEN